MAAMVSRVLELRVSISGTVSGCLADIDNNLKKEKLDQVVAIIKSCSPNGYGDLTVNMKDLSGIIPGTVHYKVIDEGGYGKDITIGNHI
ncbi:transposase, MuDR, MULE transposase domain protein [Tanacetum coccineum]